MLGNISSTEKTGEYEEIERRANMRIYDGIRGTTQRYEEIRKMDEGILQNVQKYAKYVGIRGNTSYNKPSIGIGQF